MTLEATEGIWGDLENLFWGVDSGLGEDCLVVGRECKVKVANPELKQRKGC
jgi:hypothetical protein